MPRKSTAPNRLLYTPADKINQDRIEGAFDMIFRKAVARLQAAPSNNTQTRAKATLTN